VQALTFSAKNGMSGHGTLPSRADDVCWQLTHYHHHHVIKGRIFAERDWRKAMRVRGIDHLVVCGVSVLARLFDPGHHRQVDQWPGNTASSTRTVIIEAVTGTQ